MPLKKVMYIEDEPDIQAIAKLALETVGGLQVKICSSGKEALGSVEDYQPDLILLDVMMPNMDGVNTLKALRSRADTMNIPVVFMTAKVQPQEIAEYKALGAIDVIHKPFDPMSLASTLREIWSNQAS